MIEQTALEPLRTLPLESVEAIQQAISAHEQVRAAVRAYVMEHLEDGTDFGPSFEGSKPTLLKPGAEKIAGMLRLQATFVRDAETWEMFGSPAGVICYKCNLISRQTGELVGEGRGAARLDEPSIRGRENSAVKIAEKRAQVDAILRLAELSDRFTQDMGSEDKPTGATRSDANGAGGPGGQPGDSDAPTARQGAAKQVVLCPECGDERKIIPEGISTKGKTKGKSFSAFVGHKTNRDCKFKMSVADFATLQQGQEPDEWEPPGPPAPRLDSAESYASAGAKLFAAAKAQWGAPYAQEILRMVAWQHGLDNPHKFELLSETHMTEAAYQDLSKAFARGQEG